MKNIAIKFDNVSKVYKLYKNDKERLLSVFFGKIKYKKKIAINNVSIVIEKGESVVILGKNGAGKSTLLKMITGVVFPSQGKISVNGRVSALLELKAGFDPEFTGKENIYLKGHILGLNDVQIEEVIDDIIQFAELGEYIDQPVRTYSSGMRSRLGFAINSNINPEILVIDEALSVGDYYFKKKCNDKIKQLVSLKHVTVLYVTHSPNTADGICNRAIVLEKGKIILDGDLEAAKQAYMEK